MDLENYNAAAEGKIEVFKKITDHHHLLLLLTPIENTILHIYITTLNFGSKSTNPNAGSESTINFVEEILIMCPSLLWKANAKDESPLHIAARYGHYDIVKVLIKCARTLHQDLEDGIQPVQKMLRMTNKLGDTALHEAIRYNHVDVVELLIEEDPNYSDSANDAHETPLYIAVEKGLKSVVFKILDNCKSPMHEGPFGRSVLHAAVIQCSTDKDLIGRHYFERIMNIEGITTRVDHKGWTPLHLAAYLGYSNLAVALLLYKDREAAYMKDKGGKTALHIAAQRCNVSAMKSIVSNCPDCCEMVDNKGWNVSHFAMKDDLSDDIIKIILKNSYLSNLLNEKNFDGATPLDVYTDSLASLKNIFAISKQNKKMLEIKRGGNRLPGQLPTLVITYEDDTIMTKSKDEDDEDRRRRPTLGEAIKAHLVDRRRRPVLGEATEAHLVVAALITTVTFAACITMPGGFASGGEGSHPGSALLRRSAAFKAFVITDTISMLFSSCAVFIHLLTPFRFSQEECEDLVFLAFRFILGAMVAMVLAFVTGTYAVLMPSLNLSIANCITGLTFFAILFLVFRKFIGSTFFRLLVYVLLRID